jgi:hypothetical protein
MSRLPYLTLSLLLLSAPAPAQERHRAPPAKGHKKHKDKHHGKGEGHRKHRAPPAPEPDMPVRKPVELRSITPDQGPPGTIVSLDGSNFDDTVRIRFNGRWVKVVERSNETIKVRIPRNAVTDRFVVSKAGFPDQTTDKEFGVIRTPVISGFDPRRGGPGTRVRITGQHFLPDDEFVVGPTPVTVIKRRHDRAVIRLVDGVSTGRIGVKRGGRVLAWSTAPFDVLAPPPVVADFSPPRGDRGTVVHITGENFEPTDWVELNGQRLRMKSRGPRHIDVVIGNHTTGRFLVRGRAGRRALAANPFVVVRPPRIAGFTPRYGPPGTRLVIEGSGFVDGDQVYIGNAVLTVRTVNDARIVAELPAGVTSGPVGVQRGTRRYPARGAFQVVHPPRRGHPRRLGPLNDPLQGESVRRDLVDVSAPRTARNPCHPPREPLPQGDAGDAQRPPPAHRRAQTAKRHAADSGWSQERPNQPRQPRPPHAHQPAFHGG